MAKPAMSLETLYWHDGRLDGLRLSATRRGAVTLYIDVSLYPEPVHAKTRARHVITCAGVTRFSCDCDVPELMDNRGAGNISDALVDAGTLRMELSGGALVVSAADFVLKDR